MEQGGYGAPQQPGGAARVERRWRLINGVAWVLSGALAAVLLWVVFDGGKPDARQILQQAESVWHTPTLAQLDRSGLWQDSEQGKADLALSGEAMWWRNLTTDDSYGRTAGMVWVYTVAGRETEIAVNAPPGLAPVSPSHLIPGYGRVEQFWNQTRQRREATVTGRETFLGRDAYVVQVQADREPAMWQAWLDRSSGLLLQLQRRSAGGQVEATVGWGTLSTEPLNPQRFLPSDVSAGAMVRQYWGALPYVMAQSGFAVRPLEGVPADWLSSSARYSYRKGEVGGGPIRRLEWAYTKQESWRLSVEVGTEPYPDDAKLVQQAPLFPGVEARYMLERDGTNSLRWEQGGVYYRLSSLDSPVTDLVRLAQELAGQRGLGGALI